MPMVNDGDYVAVFNSVHRVMQAEKLLKDHGLPMLLIPAPRALTSDCGLAIRYAAIDRTKVEELLASSHLLPEEIYTKEGERYMKIPSTS